jgi:hypothetical protein
VSWQLRRRIFWPSSETCLINSRAFSRVRGLSPTTGRACYDHTTSTHTNAFAIYVVLYACRHGARVRAAVHQQGLAGPDRTR